jgi:hypothetical protein
MELSPKLEITLSLLLVEHIVRNAFLVQLPQRDCLLSGVHSDVLGKICFGAVTLRVIILVESSL